MTPAASPVVTGRPMTAAEAAHVTDEIRTSGERLWSLLLASYEGRAWLALGYDSWREYVTAEFNMSRSRAYQLLDAARVQLAISEAASSTDVEISEADARDLKPILAEVVEDIAIQTATAAPEDVPAIVRDIVTEARRDEDGPLENVAFTDGYDRAVAELRRLVARFDRLHCDDQFMEHRPSLGRRHRREFDAALSALDTVAKDLRAGQAGS